MEYSYCSENITELSKALIKVQRNLTPAVKDATNPFVKNKYATLNSVMSACRSALSDAGVVLFQYPVPGGDENTLCLCTKLVHAESGQFQASLATLPLQKNDAQAFGSALSYGRRYMLSSLLGIVTEDDDGNAACNMTSAPKRSYQTQAKRAAAQQQKPLSQIMIDLGLEDMLPQYRLYLQAQYQCAPEKITAEQYQEQKTLLDGIQDAPIKMRDFLKMLHNYREQ